MRALVLGATGMLGHKMVQRLGERFEVAGTVQGEADAYADIPALAGAHLISRVTAFDMSSVARCLDEFKPDAVINCIGVIKQLKGAKDPITAISLNALLPHQLAVLCGERGIKVIHFSTDCVFSGRRGNYTEDDVPDCDDLYGRTKLLGEIKGPGCLTLRTSIIGRELRGKLSLVEWFLSNRGEEVKGFARALYSGLTTYAMADLVGYLLTDHPGLEGLWHVSGDAISKYDLLCIMNDTYNLGITVKRDYAFFCDRRLDSSRFRTRTGFVPMSWPEMIAQMHADPTVYE